MTKQEIEAFVRKVLTESFHQKADPETVKAVAEKMAKTIPQGSTKRRAA